MRSETVRNLLLRTRQSATPGPCPRVPVLLQKKACVLSHPVKISFSDAAETPEAQVGLAEQK